MDPADFRSEFPVLDRIAFLNAGSDGPVPRRGAEAAAAQIERELVEGRAGRPHFERLIATGTALRERLAVFLGCDPDDVALTRSTTDGMSTVLSSLELGPGDEVLTSDEEHPGLLAPLEAARRRRGFEVRFAPFAEIASAIGPRTRLVACSHVSWVGGKVVDARALAESDALVLLDGAQGLGAIPANVGELGCDFYGAAGQKWLCGPDGSGCLYVRPDLCADLIPPWPSYMSLAEPGRASELIPHPGARRFDLGFSGPLFAWSLAAAELFGEAGLDWINERGAALAERLADALRDRGREVAPRGRSTLVSWRSDDPEGDVHRLSEAGVVTRWLPDRGLVRASVGAWSNDDDLERLLAAL
ncbi:MAG TPA: aminotransferase class V-fold PLP-dependent enzyme [Thermoleophilaceae bacterium]|nr:aminotransferase class V-fold PLP-dependent enzyme [Thermoleophilaceae bacterium]